jgi:hypothetical protein
MRTGQILLSLLIINLFVILKVQAQTQSYKQFNNEFDFNHDLSQKWALEFNAGQSWTTLPGHDNLFSSLGQVYGRLWVHYAMNDKWKFSFFYAYYYNHYVPEIDQRQAPEWRSAMQAIYYIERRRAIITTRWRIEDRHIYNPDSVYEAVDRLRGQIKIVYPFNGKVIDLHVLYGIASEEVMFKTSSKVSGPEIFDRNKFTMGVGYGPTRNTQIELTYGNEYLPRGSVSDNYNAVQVNVVFNDVLPRLKKFIFGEKKAPEGSSAN